VASVEANSPLQRRDRAGIVLEPEIHKANLGLGLHRLPCYEWTGRLFVGAIHPAEKHPRHLCRAFTVL